MAETKDMAASTNETAKEQTMSYEARASPLSQDTKAQEMLEKARAEPKPEWEVTEQVVRIPLEQLKPFKNHPFKVRDDDELMQDTSALPTLLTRRRLMRIFPPAPRAPYMIPA